MSVDSPEVLIKRLDPRARLPSYESEGAAGADIRACLESPLTLVPGGRGKVPTGFAVAIPAGFEAQVRPRSGLAAQNGVTVLNSPGTIDADYRGEVQVILINHGGEPFIIKHGDRIAQLVFSRVNTMSFSEVSSLPESFRGTGGFGSTGV
ncbi:MAG: dUTP diphosphatase [Spirochaetaceae bacterium]|nr:dUTP diphosphatase [Spirochaetaceae bacterium]